jgi:vesicle coat complex subunit
MDDNFEETKTDLNQIKDFLDSNYKTKNKLGVKKVIFLMRSGDNVGHLFPSILRCVKTDDLELKRLIYLFLIRYSLEQSEQSIMAVNTFIQYSNNSNLVIRALAVRTISRIQIQSIAEYMILPVKKCLKDPEPFVRKTAALGAAKLYLIIPEAVESSGILDALVDLLGDENPLVVTNTCLAIEEINEKRSLPFYIFDSSSIMLVISGLISSTEWCQCSLLDILAKYELSSGDEADNLIDHIL